MKYFSMSKVIILLTVFLLIGTIFAQEGKSNKSKEITSEKEVAVITTKFGKIVIELFEKDAPLHCANFKKLIKQKFYDGTTFHRVIPNFVIQGGDPYSKDDDRTNDGKGGPGYTIPAEIKRKHLRGSVGAARLPDQINPKRESNGSQFYICLRDLPHLDGAYTVFGRVIEGMDVVDKISHVKTDQRNNPLEKVVIESIRLEKRKIEK